MNVRLPDVVKNLLIINGLFFLATIFYEDFMIEKFALFYPSSSQFFPHQFVTHIFMHGSFYHILGNMFGLFFLGPALEMRMGSKRFLIYFLITGLGAAALHLGVNYLQVIPYLSSLDPDTIEMITDDGYGVLNEGKNYSDSALGSFNLLINTPTVGASGAIFGILLAFGMLFPNVELMLMFFPIPIKAKYFVAIYGAYELFRGIQNSPSDNVAHFAHLGGMLFGFFLIRYWKNKSLL